MGVPPSFKEQIEMSLSPRLMRLAVLAALVLTAAANGGWKWEHLPH
jgi:hypothetical protein